MDACSSVNWCDVVGSIVAIVSCFVGMIGGTFAYYRWRERQKLERANILKDILDQFDKTKLCELVNRYDSEGGNSEWFARMTENEEKEISESFRFLSYICYLHEKKLITRDEFLLFESSIATILKDNDAREYLTNTPSDSEGDALNGQFAYLLRYAKRVGLCPIGIAAEKDCDSCSNGYVDLMDLKHPTAIIKINQKYRDDMTPGEIYEATRGWWRVSKDSAEKVKFVLAVAFGNVIGAYNVRCWHYQPNMNSGRMAFDGVFDEAAFKKFGGQSVKHLFAKGAANPIRYFNVNNEQ